MPGRVSIPTTASNGTTAVQLVSAVTGEKIVPQVLVIHNTSSAIRTVIFLSAATEIGWRCPIAAGVELYIGKAEHAELLDTVAGEALQFKLAEAGADVNVSGLALRTIA